MNISNLLLIKDNKDETVFFGTLFYGKGAEKFYKIIEVELDEEFKEVEIEKVIKAIKYEIENTKKEDRACELEIILNILKAYKDCHWYMAKKKI